MAEFEFLRAGNSEATEKKALSALFDPASGVLSGLVVTQTTTASGSVLIASGSALVHPSAVSASLLGNDTSKTLDVFTANPVGGLPRNDIVEFDQITASIIVHVGTPNATPTDPTVPATSVALARLRHAASATTIPTAKIDTLIVDTTLRGVVGQLARFRGVVTAAATVTGGTPWPFATGAFVVLEDNLAAWNAGTSQWVAPVAGTYLVMAQVRTSAAVAGEFIAISVNGTYVATSPFLIQAISGGGHFACYLRLAAGDGVSVAAGQTFVTVNGTTVTNDTWLEIVQVGF
jgi:hypothetical protein